MNIKDLAQVFVFEQTMFNIIDIASDTELGEYNPRFIVKDDEWPDDQLNLFQQEVAHVYIERINQTESTLRVEIYDRRSETPKQ